MVTPLLVYVLLVAAVTLVFLGIVLVNLAVLPTVRRDHGPSTAGRVAVLVPARNEEANIEACLTRPHAFALTVLLWHGGTVAAVAALCALTGGRWLRWPTLATR